MISTKKRGLCLILALCTVFLTMTGYCKTVRAATTFHNTLYADIVNSIDSDGRLETILHVDGFKGITTLIETDLYVEKRILGIFWIRVDIGYTNNVWHDSTTDYHYSNYFDTQLSSHGTYRVTVTYTVSGTGGTPDVIVLTDTDTY